MASTSNITSPAGPFPKDFVLAVPRMMARAGSFAFDSMLGFRYGGTLIAEATGNRTWSMVSEALSSGSVASTAAPIASEAVAAAAAAADYSPRSLGLFGFLQGRNFGGIFAYMTSKWAMACFTLVSLQYVIGPTEIFTWVRD